MKFDIPDDVVASFITSMSAMAKAMQSAMAALPQAVDVPGAAAPPATIDAPFGARDDGQPFKSQAEADTWHAAVAQRDANLADTGSVPGPVPASADALISLDYGQRTEWFRATPGQIIEVEALAAGNVSATTGSGSFFVFLDRVRTIDSADLVYSSGGGGARLALTKGQHAFIKFDGPDPQDMRVELL